MPVNVNIRFGEDDEGIHQAVKQSAGEYRRSFNAQALWLLQRGLDGPAKDRELYERLLDVRADVLRRKVDRYESGDTTAEAYLDGQYKGLTQVLDLLDARMRS
jgi:hypothetical protein